jgi:hypothetical protein
LVGRHPSETIRFHAKAVKRSLQPKCDRYCLPDSLLHCSVFIASCLNRLPVKNSSSMVDLHCCCSAVMIFTSLLTMGNSVGNSVGTIYTCVCSVSHTFSSTHLIAQIDSKITRVLTDITDLNKLIGGWLKLRELFFTLR